MEDKIADLCYKKYSELSKNGKPKENEWTFLSGFLIELADESLHLVSLATGTKCIGKSMMAPTGSMLNDSHAEMLSRRGLVRYIYEQIELTLGGDSSMIFNVSGEGKCCLKPGTEFHFFSSHVPCGDASIVPMLKRKCHDDNPTCDNPKRLKTEDKSLPLTSENGQCKDDLLNEYDVHRTGGKAVCAEDPCGPGSLYHVLGAVRTKPGRGEPTLSLSCSDKIAKWIFCGIQGALLSILLADRIRLKSITIGGGGQFCPEAMERALLDRCRCGFRPVIKQSSFVFQHSKYSSGRQNPCPTAITWALVKNKALEVSVEGRRQGVTKKCSESASRLQISKMELFKHFIRLTGDKYRQMTYRQAKAKAVQYYLSVEQFKSLIGCWSEKPALLLDFTAESSAI